MTTKDVANAIELILEKQPNTQPITAANLAAMTIGINTPGNRRLVGNAIAHLVSRGVPVCGSYCKNKGYFIPKTKDDAIEVLSSGFKRVQSTRLRFARLHKALNDRFDSNIQLNMFGNEA